MLNCRKIPALALAALIAMPATAQDVAAEIEAQNAQAAEEARVVEERARFSEMEAREVELAMKQAEEKMAEAARQMAELSRRQLPQMEEVRRFVSMAGRPVLGVTIGRNRDDGPVEGVEIIAVSPGGAAAEAGLRAGDVITSVNGESLTSESSDEANDKLLDFMEGVEEGDLLDIDYLRNGNTASVELSPRPVGSHAFAFGVPGFDVEVSPGGPNVYKWAWRTDGSVWGGMELVALSEQLGKYFGADKGLLVVKAPDNDELELQDGDVILEIDGREPTSVSHAMRILGSYESGEALNIEIMRDKRKRTLSLTMPDNRRSGIVDFTAPRAGPRVVIAPRPAPRAPVPADERT